MIRSKIKSSLVLFTIIPILLFSQVTLYVQRVIDGDTIELNNGEKVRLIGVDTPETVHPGKPVEYYGKEASNFTRNLCEGKKVRLEYDWQKADKYGRTLAYVFIIDDDKETFLNAELIKQGYAHAYTKYPFKDDYMKAFREYERNARNLDIGLWKQISKKDDLTPENNNSDEIVYITKTGSKYHRENCRYLSKSKIPIMLSDAVNSYSPCSVCNPPLYNPSFEPIRRSIQEAITTSDLSPPVAFQFALKLLGYDPGKIDGIIGPKTKNAISLYQRDHYLSVTGNINNQTIQSILRSLSKDSDSNISYILRGTDPSSYVTATQKNEKVSDEKSKIVPHVAENGSYYGEISKDTGRPKTVYVKGYYRKDGTYVRSHYRSKSKRK